MELKRIGPWSAAKVGAITGLIFGLIGGIIYAIALMILAAILESSAMMQSGGAVFAFGAGAGIISIILITIGGGLGGLILGALYAWLYNLAAKWVGGINLEFAK